MNPKDEPCNCCSNLEHIQVIITGPGLCQIEELPEPLLNLIRDIQNQNQHDN